MHPAESIEHFVTLFDSHFLPMGMALHASLMTHAQPFHLWVICMDEQVEAQLDLLALPHLTLLPLRELEDARLLMVKPGRSRGEYCWTVTPFTFEAVFRRDGNVKRVTYLDADLFFFADPRILLRELEVAGKHVLITEHAYAPEYDSTFRQECGRFCVQFLTFRNTPEAQRVMNWWQEKCLEWCFDRCEPGRFGDQKYLDCWPETFSEETHVVQQVEKTLAPWNVNYFAREAQGAVAPVFYHFHGFRIRNRREVMVSRYYDIGNTGMLICDNYINTLKSIFKILSDNSIDIPVVRDNTGFFKKIFRRIARIDRYKCI